MVRDLVTGFIPKRQSPDKSTREREREKESYCLEIETRLNDGPAPAAGQ